MLPLENRVTATTQPERFQPRIDPYGPVNRGQAATGRGRGSAQQPRNGWSDRSIGHFNFGVAHLDDPPVRTFKTHGGKLPGAVGPSVQPDAVRQVDHFLSHRVAVHHDLFEGCASGQEFIANPAKIGGALVGKGDAGADPGMDKGVVALDNHVLE